MTEVLQSEIITNNIVTILTAFSTKVISMLYKIHYKIHMTREVTKKYSYYF